MNNEGKEIFDILRAIRSCRGLTPAAKLVAESLFDRQGRNEYAYPSLNKICDDCGICKQTADTAIKQLESAGLVTVLREDRPGPNKSNRYRFNRTSLKIRPVQKIDQSKKENRPSLKNRPEPVQKIDPNDSITDSFNDSGGSLDKKDINNRELEPANQWFKEAYDLYQGTKRSLTTEFLEFKNIQDWAKCLPLLKLAIEKMNQARKAKDSRGEFVPALKRFQNWLRDRDWETSDPEAEKVLREAQSKADAEQKMIERKKQNDLKTYGDYIRTAPANELREKVKIGYCPKRAARELRPELFDKESA